MCVLRHARYAAIVGGETRCPCTTRHRWLWFRPSARAASPRCPGRPGRRLSPVFAFVIIFAFLLHLPPRRNPVMKYRDQIPFFRRELAQLGRPFPTLSFESFRQVMARAPTP